MSDKKELLQLRQLQKQLELSKKTVKKLRRDKNELTKKIDKINKEKSKLETQVHHKNVERERKMREFEASKRHQIWKLKHEYFTKMKSDKSNTSSSSNSANNMDTEAIDFYDPEIEQIFGKIYQIENAIQRSLMKFDLKHNQFNAATDSLDASFETISLLLQESNAQKAIIRQLNDKIREMQKVNGQKRNNNGFECVNNEKSLIAKLRKNNIKYQSDIHSLEIEMEVLKKENVIKQTKIESYQYEIESLQTILQSERQQNELMKKRMKSIQCERDRLMRMACKG